MAEGGSANPIKRMVVVAKKTLSEFAMLMEKNTDKLLYGKKAKLESDLERLEEEKANNVQEVDYIEEFEDPLTGEISYEETKFEVKSKEEYDETNREIGNRKAQLLKDAQNPFKNPAIVPITQAVRRINTFNLCNPFTMGINATFPPGSPVSNAVKDVQTKLKGIQDLFRNFRIIEGNKTVDAQSAPFAIREGLMAFSVTGPDFLENGTRVYIQQTNNNQIFTNMVGTVTGNNLEGSLVEAPTSLQSYASSQKDTTGLITPATANFNFPSLPNVDTNLTNTTEDSSFTGIDLGKLPKKARRKLKKKGLGTKIPIDASGLGTTTNSSTSEFLTQDLTVPNLVGNKPEDTFKKYAKQNEYKTIVYSIEISRFDPLDPPTRKTRNGNTILDEEGNAVLETFTNWSIEYEAKMTSDIRELAEDLQGITDALRELGINQIIQDLSAVPDSFPLLGDIKKALTKVALFVDDKVVPIAGDAANRTGTAAQALAGGINSTEVIRRSRELSDFYAKLQPIINFDLSLENIFRKQITDINKTLRSVIPYKALAKIVKVIKQFVNFIVKIVDFILGILKFLNMIIKTLIVVAKVLRTVIKIVQTVAMALPNMFITAGVTNKFQDVITKVMIALDLAIRDLEEISGYLDKSIKHLSFLRGWLMILVGELGKLQQTFETCDNLDKAKEGERLDVTGIIQGAVSAATGIPFPDNQVRNNVEDFFEEYTTPSYFDNGKAASSQSVFGQTLVTLSDGTIIMLPGTVWGFSADGQIMFGGDLISLSTGVNFEETRGQEFRRMLRKNFNFYTFNKFKDAKYANLVEGLIEQSIELYADNVEKANQEAATDKFGNFQEKFMGYVIRIQEEKPLEDTAKGESNLIRRRGVAFDNDGKLFAASDLTFSDDLNLIVNETKFKIRRNIELGIMDVGTLDNQTITDDDALKLAETTGANKLAVSNIKAQANNRDTSIQGPGGDVDPTPIAMRTGNEPFEEVGGQPAESVDNQSSPNKTINPAALIQEPFAEFISENPSLKKMQDTFKLLQGASMSELSAIMSDPGALNLNGEELAEKLKNNILGSIDPNPEHVEEIKKKTEVWYEGLKEKAKVDYDQLVLNTHPKQRSRFPTFEVYFDGIEQEELEKWVKFLLTKDYTESEIQAGIKEDELRDEYKIGFNVKGKGGRILKVQIKRRNARLRSRMK